MKTFKKIITLLLVLTFCLAVGCGKEKITPTLSSSTLALELGASQTLTANFTVESWTTSDAKVATVSDGKVYAVSTGTATITATGEGFTVTCEVTVTYTPTEIADFSITNPEHLNLIGRVEEKDGNLVFANSASGFEVAFYGTELSASFTSHCTTGTAYLKVFVDGKSKRVKVKNSSNPSSTVLANNLTEGLHIVKAYKCIEEDFNTLTLSGFGGENVKFYTPPAKSALKIEFYGDSITAGYGTLGITGAPHNSETDDGTETYAFYACQELGAEPEVMCMQGISLSVENWRNDYLLKDRITKYSVKSEKEWTVTEHSQVIVINIGTNDIGGIASGKGTLANFISDYKATIAKLQQINPDAHIICAYGMMDITLNQPIADMVEELNNDKVHALELYQTKFTTDFGAGNHPSLSNHESNGTLLAKFIRELNIGF